MAGSTGSPGNTRSPPTNLTEIEALNANHGRTLGYVRVVAHRTDTELDEPVVSISTSYRPEPLLRTSGT